MGNDDSEKQNQKQLPQGEIIPENPLPGNGKPGKKPPGRWKPGESGNPAGRPKKKDYLPGMVEAVGRWKVPPEVLLKIPEFYRKKIKTFGSMFSYLVWLEACRMDRDAWRILHDVIIKRKFTTLEEMGIPIEGSKAIAPTGLTPEQVAAQLLSYGPNFYEDVARRAGDNEDPGSDGDPEPVHTPPPN